MWCWLKTSLEGGLEFLVGYRGFGFHSYGEGGGIHSSASPRRRRRHRHTAANIRRHRGKLSLVDFPLIRFPLFISRPNCVRDCATLHCRRRHARHRRTPCTQTIFSENSLMLTFSTEWQIVRFSSNLCYFKPGYNDAAWTYKNSITITRIFPYWPCHTLKNLRCFCYPEKNGADLDFTSQGAD